MIVKSLPCCSNLDLIYNIPLAYLSIQLGGAPAGACQFTSCTDSHALNSSAAFCAHIPGCQPRVFLSRVLDKEASSRLIVKYVLFNHDDIIVKMVSAWKSKDVHGYLVGNRENEVFLG